MKILFICHYFYPRIGGVEKHVENVSSELVRDGHSVTVLTSRHDSELSEKETMNSVDVKRISLDVNWASPSKFKLWKWFLTNFSFVNGFDVIHIHDVHIWLLPLSFLLRKKMFITFHGFEGKYPPSIKALAVRKIAEYLTLRNICVGDYIAKWYKTKPDLVTYGAVNNSAPLNFKMNKYFFCFLGRLEKDTAAELFINYLKKFGNNSYNGKVIFLGDGPLKPEAEKVGQVLGFQKNISTYLAKSKYIFATGYLSLLDAYIQKKLAFVAYDNPLRKDYYLMSPHRDLAVVVSSSKQLDEKVSYYEKNLGIKNERQNYAQKWALKQNYKKLASQYLKLWQN